MFKSTVIATGANNCKVTRFCSWVVEVISLLLFILMVIFGFVLLAYSKPRCNVGLF
ncbi:hypothetical protein ACJA29_03900 [Metamycoplasma sualvi]|uniref:hypothetical protein n=1 Tax=Metamycoplasma sualvi TaxID=2125 RepID=UPI003873619C